MRQRPTQHGSTITLMALAMALGVAAGAGPVAGSGPERAGFSARQCQALVSLFQRVTHDQRQVRPLRLDPAHQAAAAPAERLPTASLLTARGPRGEARPHLLNLPPPSTI